MLIREICSHQLYQQANYRQALCHKVVARLLLIILTLRISYKLQLQMQGKGKVISNENLKYLMQRNLLNQGIT
jgi:uncharacterized protein YqhQ